MLKVVLVDDEPSVLEGLRFFVNWSKMGFEIVGEASDGAASFSVICQTRPELVICDIRMPGLTGLELIEKVNANITPAPKFILLSGYNDFAYAQKALQLGALGYLTKPLDSEELTREMSRAAAMIENEKSVKQENLELIRYTANQLYNDIMDGKRSEKLIRKARFIFDIPANAKICVVQLIADAGEKTNNNPETKIYDLLMHLTGIQNENCVFYNGSGSYVIVMHDGMQAFSCNSKLAGQLSEQLKSVDAQDYGFYAFWTLISGVSDSEVLESIYSCGKQLEQLQTYCMLHPENSVIYYEALDESLILFEQSKPEVGTVFPELPFDKIVNALKGNDAHEISNAVDDFFYKLNQNGGSLQFYSICLYRLADIVRKLAYAYGIEANRVILNFNRSIGNINPNCKKLALEMCNFIFQKQNINNDKPLVLLENEIINYIKANYRKSLSLQNIAEKFSLSAIIISKIIKKKTGKKFNDYFNYLRIEYAKMLIASANMKIIAVCEEAGYADYCYFTEKFKEFTGVSPSEYKKKYS
ncbi:MAG: response regulator transcription factor [Ruminiclostridium sp.]